MARTSVRCRIAHYGLALALTVAGTLAPFRSHTLGRTLLYTGNHLGHAPIVRVRALTGAGLVQGFRVVVGVARGGRDRDADASPPRERWKPAGSAPAHPTSSIARLAARPHPPLRC
jgi:hypothetical protein